MGFWLYSLVAFHWHPIYFFLASIVVHVPVYLLVPPKRALLQVPSSFASALMAADLPSFSYHRHSLVFLAKVWHVSCSKPSCCGSPFCPTWWSSCVGLRFNYKVKITTEQFFKYGFAEQKMMLCLDTIQCVKNKHKEIKIQRSLSAKRSNLTRSADSSRYSKVSHSLGQNSNFKFERITPMKIAKVEQEKPDLRTPTKSLNVSFDIKTETSVAKKRDPQASLRLLGACKVPNRHSKQAGEALAQQQQPQAKP